MKATTRKNKSTRKEMTAVEKLEPDWWRPQLDTPIGRVELDFLHDGTIRVRRAGYLQSSRRLTSHYDNIGLTRTAPGRWKPAETYRDPRDQKTALALGETVTAWAAANDDLARRCAALREDQTIGSVFGGSVRALGARVEKLSAEIESGLFDFNDAGHARAVATKAVERLLQMMDKIAAVESEIQQAIAPSTKAAA
jgi:hypothetical protein